MISKIICLVWIEEGLLLHGFGVLLLLGKIGIVNNCFNTIILECKAVHRVTSSYGCLDHCQLPLLIPLFLLNYDLLYNLFLHGCSLSSLTGYVASCYTLTLQQALYLGGGQLHRI